MPLPATAWEKKMRDHPQRQHYALLRDQSKGTVTAKTLQQLREEYENKQLNSLPLLDYNASCIHCGVGDFVLAGEQNGSEISLELATAV